MSKGCDIGGQALIEGVMMRGISHYSIAVRKPDGDIEVKTEKTPEYLNYKFFKLPIIRGMVALVSAMAIGINALSYSAKTSGIDIEEDDSKFDKFIKDKFKDKANAILTGITIIVSFGLAILLFGALPTLLSSFFRSIITNPILLSIVEGVFKLALFLLYIFAISRLPDIRRVFEYHGAEHMSIHCLEAQKELTVENVAEFSPIHERCGTSFLIYLMFLSIVIYSFFTWTSITTRIILKILFLPVIAGLGYEVLKLNAKVKMGWLRILSKPGLWLQKITTQKPHKDQIEVAIAALKGVLAVENNKN